MCMMLTINMNNSAFDGESHELERLLRELADRVSLYGYLSGPVRDVNGNHVGELSFLRNGNVKGGK